MDEDKRSNMVEAFAKPLNIHLQRLNALRVAIPATERGNRPTLRVVFKPPPEPPATPEEFIREMIKLDVTYPFPTLTTEEKSARNQVFRADLKHLPLWKLEKACQRYRQSSEKFHPTPGALLAFARGLP